MWSAGLTTRQRGTLAGAATIAAAVGIVLVARYGTAGSRSSTVSLPFDDASPVVYDNDWTNDYVDWYLMALASVGEISYRGISTSSSIAPYNRHMSSQALDEQVRIRAEIVEMGRKAGFRNIPDPVPGTRGHLEKPSSGRIEDTRPLDAAGSRLIVEQARTVSPETPLVVLLRGPATVVANAYLLDNSIADNVVIAIIDNHADGLHGFNGWSDGWAATIILQKFRVVLLPVFPAKEYPRLSKEWILAKLPASDARDFMVASELDVVNGDDGDADGMAAVVFIVPEYVRASKRATFSGWTTRDGHELPMLSDDPKGPVIVVTSADGALATAEYQRAFTNPSIWQTP